MPAASSLVSSIAARDHAISKWLCANFGNFLNDTNAHWLRKASTDFWKFVSLTNEGYLWVLSLPSAIYTVYKLRKPEHVKFFRLSFLAVAVDLAMVGLLKVLTRRNRPNYLNQNMHDKKMSYVDFHIGPDKFSFPSGHCSRGAMLSILFYCWLNSKEEQQQNNSHNNNNNAADNTQGASPATPTTQHRNAILNFLNSLPSAAATTDNTANNNAQQQSNVKRAKKPENRLMLIAGMGIWLWLLMGLSRVVLARHFLSDVLSGYVLGIAEAYLFMKLSNSSFMRKYFPTMFPVFRK